MKVNKKHRKKGSNYKMGSLATLDENSSANFLASAIGLLDSDGLFCDMLSKNHERYKVFLDLKDALNALNSGKLNVNEPYCYSLYSYEYAFPKLDSMRTIDEKVEYLKEYNKQNDVAIFWTFLDVDEKEKLEEKQKRLYREY